MTDPSTITGFALAPKPPPPPNITLGVSKPPQVFATDTPSHFSTTVSKSFVVSLFTSFIPKYCIFSLFLKIKIVPGFNLA